MEKYWKGWHRIFKLLDTVSLLDKGVGTTSNSQSFTLMEGRRTTDKPKCEIISFRKHPFSLHWHKGASGMGQSLWTKSQSRVKDSFQEGLGRGPVSFFIPFLPARWPTKEIQPVLLSPSWDHAREEVKGWQWCNNSAHSTMWDHHGRCPGIYAGKTESASVLLFICQEIRPHLQFD